MRLQMDGDTAGYLWRWVVASPGQKKKAGKAGDPINRSEGLRQDKTNQNFKGANITLAQAALRRPLWWCGAQTAPNKINTTKTTSTSTGICCC
jgi:hypothetical protein